MSRRVHSLPALLLGLFLVLIAGSGAVLSVQPAVEAAAAPPAAGLTIGTAAANVARAQPGLVALSRSANGVLTAQIATQTGRQTLTVDPATGAPLPPVADARLMRWIKGFHRTFQLNDPGRAAAGLLAAAMAVVAGSGLWLLVRALGGWGRLGAPVRVGGARGWHARIGRVALAGLALSSLTGAWLSAASFGLVPDGSAPSVTPVTAATARARPLDGLAALDAPLDTLRDLRLPVRAGEAVTLDAGGAIRQIDPPTGAVLSEQAYGRAARLWEWAYLLHTGQGLWWLGLVLGVAAAAVPALAVTGTAVWLARRGPQLRRRDQPALVPMAEADLVILVGSEGGTTRGFARALHQALTAAGRRVHLGDMNDIGPMPNARALVVMAATWGDGTAPASATDFLDRLAGVVPLPVAVLGFGDRAFPDFCGYAARVDAALDAAGFARLMAPGCVDRQSPSDFAAWGRALGQALGLDIAPEHRPALPRRHQLRVTDRRTYGEAVQAPSVILRLAVRPWWLGGPRFQAGDLLGILAPGATAPRFYSLASSSSDGFAEIAVRKVAGGVCSPWLHDMAPGARLSAFVRRNPAFRAQARPLIMVATGCGVAPMAGLLRRAAPGTERSLYFGMRDPASDFLYQSELSRWQGDGRLTRLVPAVSRAAERRHVQDRLRDDAATLRRQIAQGARVLVCGSVAMGRAVAAEMDALLAPVGLTVASLKHEGRYVEDIY